MLARRKRCERHGRMSVGNGEVHDDADVVARQQRIDGHRLYAELRALRVRHFGPQVGAGAQLHARRRREVGEVDSGNVAAADEADADILHGRSPHQAAIAARERRAKLSKSAGLSCSSTSRSSPLAESAGFSRSQSMTPSPISVQPSSFAFSPSGALSFTCTALTRSRYFSIQRSGSSPAAWSQPMSASQRRLGAASNMQVERIAAVGELAELEIVVVPGERQALRGEPVADPRELAAEPRQPSASVGRASGGMAGTIEELDAEVARLRRDRVEGGAQAVDPDMRRRRLQAVPLEPRFEPAGIGEEPAIGLDIDVAEARERRELGFERWEFSRGIELEGETIEKRQGLAPARDECRLRRRKD